MKFLKLLIIPGAGFRTWLVLVAVAATFTGFITSKNIFAFTPLVWLLAACFALLSLGPIGAALWVSARHTRLNQRQTAVAYALVPVVAVVIAVLCGWTGFRVTEWRTAQAQVRKFSLAIEAARETGQIVETAIAGLIPDRQRELSSRNQACSSSASMSSMRNNPT